MGTGTQADDDQLDHALAQAIRQLIADAVDAGAAGETGGATAETAAA